MRLRKGRQIEISKFKLDHAARPDAIKQLRVAAEISRLRIWRRNDGAGAGAGPAAFDHHRRQCAATEQAAVVVGGDVFRPRKSKIGIRGKSQHRRERKILKIDIDSEVGAANSEQAPRCFDLYADESRRCCSRRLQVGSRRIACLHNCRIQRGRRCGTDQIGLRRQTDVFRLQLPDHRGNVVAIHLLHFRFGEAAIERAQLRRLAVAR